MQAVNIEQEPTVLTVVERESIDQQNQRRFEVWRNSGSARARGHIRQDGDRVPKRSKVSGRAWTPTSPRQSGEVGTSSCRHGELPVTRAGCVGCGVEEGANPLTIFWQLDIEIDTVQSPVQERSTLPTSTIGRRQEFSCK